MDIDLAPVEAAAKSAREWTERRDRRIRNALSAGASLSAVARAAGLSREGVRKISQRTG